MKKSLKYIILSAGVFLVIFLSLDIRKLDSYKETNIDTTFDPVEYVTNFWENQLPLVQQNASEISIIIQLLNSNPEKAFNEHARKLGISKTHYFMLKGKGIINSVEEEYLLVSLDNKSTIKIATDFIFGNAVRDGSGVVNINEFINMTDFNNVSVQLNKKVKEKVISNLINTAKIGNTIEFVGATEVNEEKIDVANILIIPVSVKLTDGEKE